MAMVNLRAVYRLSEEHMRLATVGLFVFVLLLIAGMTVLSPVVIVAGVIALILTAVTIIRPLAALAMLSVYLPFEPFILKFVPDEIYLFARFFSEGLIYVLAAIVLARIISGRLRPTPTPIGLPFALFCVVLVAASLINLVPATVAILGARQILRFILVFFITVHLAPSKEYIKRLLYVLCAVAILQSGIGLAQSVIGEPLDTFLLPSEERTFGEITITTGTQAFWDPGSRVFATLGRYDRLGNFLYLLLLFGVGVLYQKSTFMRKEVYWLLGLGIPALVLTFSRASWFAFLFGFLFIALYLARDKRVAIATAVCVVVSVLYVGLSGLNVRFITESSGQTLVERFYETFSYARWRGEYYGLGRVFWLVQTPLVVIPAAPLFGWGPGQYGGGAVAALGNTRVYDQLGLPFGVFGTDGYIDNNWFSLWGESGTLGLVFFLWMYFGLFVYAMRVYRVSSDPFTRALCAGFMAMQIGAAFNASLSTIFEIRTFGFYLWMFAGFVVALRAQERAHV